MNLRTQIMLSVLPLFLAVGVLGAILRYSTEETELRWGLKEEAEGYGYALRPRLEASGWEELAKATDAGKDLVGRLEQIMSLGRVRRIVGVSPERAATVFDFTAEADARRKLVIEDETLRSIRAGQNWASTPAEGENILSFLPVRDASGVIIGALGVEVLAQDYWTEVQALYRAVVIQATWALLIGFACALVIVRVVSKGIRRVEKQARSIQLSNAQNQRDGAQDSAQGSVLKELGDLSSGLRTMQSTMYDIQQRAHMDLFERERFLLEEELTRLFQTESPELLELEVDGLQLLGCQAQSPVQGDFIKLFRTNNHIYAVYGKVHGDDLSTRMRNASAAGRLSTELLALHDIKDAWEKLRHTFSFEYWTCLRLSSSPLAAECWEAPQGEKSLVRTEIQAHGEHLFQHNLPAKSGQKVERYLAVFCQKKPLEIMPELTAIVRETGRGALVLVGEA